VNLKQVTNIRELNNPADMPAIERIWREVGWVDGDEEKVVKQFFSTGDTLVATINEVPECSVHTISGEIRLQQTDLALCVVSAVTTSRIARGHAFAQRLTALQLQRSAQRGSLVAALGMFDQGFYDLVGFGSGGYDHQFTFDPGDLLVDHRVATPRRLSTDDYVEIHKAMVNRRKVNGSVVIDSDEMMGAVLKWSKNGFGLGYGEPGELTHFMWFSGEAERGPYRVEHMAYQDSEQLMQLFSLLKSLADQVYSVKMMEPPEVQLQDLLKRPFRNSALSAKGPHAASHESFAWWQLRILDVSACIAGFSTRLPALRFSLRVSDPLEEILQVESAGDWLGVGGDYIVELAESSSATLGQDETLPLLECSVNALTRMLFGVAPASSLAISDDLSAPSDLLAYLDEVISLRTPHTGWDF